MPEAFNKKFLRDAYLEDYRKGLILEYGPVRFEKEDIIDFAERYDPQYFHVDEELAEDSQFGGLIASGWHTCSVMMRLLVDNFISKRSSLGSPGVEKILWIRPVRPKDSLKLKLEIIENRLSKTKPDRGLVRSKIEMFNQHDVLVLEMETIGFFLSKHFSG